MFYKLLGVVALLVGVVFALLTLAVVLPFLSNFNISLLALIVLFGVFAVVFLSVGWQLLHPPPPRTDTAPSEEESSGDTLASPVVAATEMPPSERVASPTVPEPRVETVRPVPAAALPLDEEDYVSAVASQDDASGTVAKGAGPVSQDDELDFSWVSPAPRRGATFVGLDEAHTDLEEGDVKDASSDGQADDPYFLRPHGYFRKPGAPVRSDEGRD